MKTQHYSWISGQKALTSSFTLKKFFMHGAKRFSVHSPQCQISWISVILYPRDTALLNSKVVHTPAICLSSSVWGQDTCSIFSAHFGHSANTNFPFILAPRSGWSRRSGGNTLHFIKPRYRKWTESVGPKPSVRIRGWPMGYGFRQFTKGDSGKKEKWHFSDTFNSHNVWLS